MGKKDQLSCLDKRDLLNRANASVDVLMRWGSHYEQAGQIYDALDFYEKAGDREGLERLLGIAVEQGDSFLFGRVCRLLECQPGQEEWLALAGQAEELGKTAFAAAAYEKAGIEPEKAGLSPIEIEAADGSGGSGS